MWKRTECQKNAEEKEKKSSKTKKITPGGEKC